MLGLSSSEKAFSCGVPGHVARQTGFLFCYIGAKPAGKAAAQLDVSSLHMCTECEAERGTNAAPFRKPSPGVHEWVIEIQRQAGG